MNWNSVTNLSVRWQVLLAVCVSGVGATVAIVFRSSITELGSWGYLGAFGISAISSASIFLPGPGIAILIVMVQDFNPLILGIAAGIGNALGASTAYLVGRLGTGAIQTRRSYRFALWCMEKFGGGILFTFTLIPLLPMDAGSILAGVCRYPLYRFYLYITVASIMKMTTIFYGFSVFQDKFQELLMTSLENWIRELEIVGPLFSF